MSSENIEKKPGLRRVILTNLASETLRNWKEQLNAAFPGFEVSERNLIEWSVSQSQTLTRGQLNDLRSLFFDEVKHLEAIITQLQSATSEEERAEIRRSLAVLVGPKAPSRILKTDSEKAIPE